MDSLDKITYPLLPGTLHCDPEKGQSVGRKHLVNKLNFINFQDRTLLVNFKHKKFGTILSFQAKPLPCSGDRLECVWVGNPDLDRVLQTHILQNILIADGKKLLLVNPEMLNASGKGIEFLLPETCSEVGSRKVKRHQCTNVKVQIIQNGAHFIGFLKDFSALSLRVEVIAMSPQMIQWMNLDFPANLNIFFGNDILYSGDCRIMRNASEHEKNTFVLQPVHCEIHRFRPKKYRSTRQELVPSPNIVFEHPFTGKTVNLKIDNLSGTGFAVRESEANSVLLPGMILPCLELRFSSNYCIKCKAQVVYRHSSAEGEAEGQVKCGLAIIDMDIGDHLGLLSILHQVSNGDSYICTSVDMDALWNFFFDAGFIYPEKYAFFQANKETVKKTYERLYSHSPHIARHFICQEEGTILGHMAMVRFYENSWLIHHHAANRSQYMKAGLNVLNQIGRFINDSHNLYSAHMKYVFCYFRPNNKFPERVFGGLARELKDPAGCSLDTFAYFHIQRSFRSEEKLPGLWELAKTQTGDIRELQSFYGQESGGLMLNALDLAADSIDRNQLSREYQKLNFKRDSHLFSLKKNESLKAIIMVNISDVGLNMSNLTNCINVFVLDGDELPRDVLNASLDKLSSYYDEQEIPVLLYPLAYAESHDIRYEKTYTLWVLNMQHTDHYFKYLASLIKSIQY
jgi:hypothetical protein